jgi:hypothetical protein
MKVEEMLVVDHCHQVIQIRNTTRSPLFETISIPQHDLQA